MRNHFIAAALVAITQAQRNSYDSLFRRPQKPATPDGFDFFPSRGNQQTNSNLSFDPYSQNYNTFDYNKPTYDHPQPQPQPQPPQPQRSYYPQPLPPKPVPVVVKPVVPVIKPHDHTAWEFEKPWEQCQRDIKSFNADILRTSATCPTSSSVTSTTLSLAAYAAQISAAEAQMDLNTQAINNIVI